jgi:hypothetical protein
MRGIVIGISWLLLPGGFRFTTPFVGYLLVKVTPISVKRNI